MFDEETFQAVLDWLLCSRRVLLDLFTGVSQFSSYPVETLEDLSRRIDKLDDVLARLGGLQRMGPIETIGEASGVEVTPVVTQ